MKRLLPRPFKYLGYGLVLLLILTLVVLQSYDPTLLKGWENGKELILSIMAVGFLLAIVSKDKVEDERVNLLRMQSFTWAFLFGILYNLSAIFFPSEGTEFVKSSTGLMLLIELGYLGSFEVSKLRARMA